MQICNFTSQQIVLVFLLPLLHLVGSKCKCNIAVFLFLEKEIQIFIYFCNISSAIHSVRFPGYVHFICSQCNTAFFNTQIDKCHIAVFFLGGKKSLIQMLPNPLLPPIIYFPGVQHMASNALMEAACLHDCLK